MMAVAKHQGQEQLLRELTRIESLINGIGIPTRFSEKTQLREYQDLRSHYRRVLMGLEYQKHYLPVERRNRIKGAVDRRSWVRRRAGYRQRMIPEENQAPERRCGSERRRYRGPRG